MTVCWIYPWSRACICQLVFVFQGQVHFSPSSSHRILYCMPHHEPFSPRTGWPTVLEFLELFWNFFGTGNVLEKSHFFRLVLELFLTSDFLGYNISGCPPCLDLPFVRKYYLSFAQLFVLEKCENVLELFWNFFKNSVGRVSYNIFS